MSDELRELVRSDVLSRPAEWCVTRWVLEASPFVFAGLDAAEFWSWKERLAQGIKVDPKDILLTGSASAGVSLSPYKAIKSFDPQSDIDVAVISGYHFDVSWRTLRQLGARFFALPSTQRHAVSEHVNRYIYWGTIATDRLLPILPFAEEWMLTIRELARVEPTRDREIKLRIYRDFASVRAYLLMGVTQLRDNLLASESEEIAGDPEAEQ